VRFYDLSREPIVCPSCGAHCVADAAPMLAEADARAARLVDRTGWRGRGFKRPDPQPDAAPEVAAPEDATEETLIPVPNEDAVLEEEPDEGDITGLLGDHEVEPKER
jgi:hypothetical protein